MLGSHAVGSAFVLGPEGLRFKTAIQVTLPYDPDEVPSGSAPSSLRIRISPREVLSFTELATTVDEAKHLLTARTLHFSIVVPSVGAVPGACTELVNSAPMVAKTRVAGSAPTPLGGAVVSGVYHRTATVMYTGPGGATGASGRRIQQTLRITTTSSNTVTFEEIQNDFDDPESRSAGTLTLSGTSLRLDRSCPSAASRSFGYSFSGDTLVISEPTARASAS